MPIMSIFSDIVLYVPHTSKFSIFLKFGVCNTPPDTPLVFSVLLYAILESCDTNFAGQIVYKP